MTMWRRDPGGGWGDYVGNEAWYDAAFLGEGDSLVPGAGRFEDQVEDVHGFEELVEEVWTAEEEPRDGGLGG